MNVTDKVKEMISYITDRNMSGVTGDTLLYEELGLNSFEMIRLIYETENEFDTEIDKDIYSGFRTISDITGWLEKEGAGK